MYSNVISRKLRTRDTSKYHIQLSIAIFFMLLVFVAGIDKTNVYGGCVFVSTLIHYFTLAAVMWMGAEATLMFHKLVLVFRRVTKQGIIITSLICWSKFQALSFSAFIFTYSVYSHLVHVLHYVLYCSCPNNSCADPSYCRLVFRPWCGK